MSRQLAFSSTISAMVMAVFVLSTTVKAQGAATHSPVAPIAQVGAAGGR